MSNIRRTIGKLVSAISVLSSMMEFSDENRLVRHLLSSLAFLHVILPISNIESAFWRSISTMPIGLIITPLPFIRPTCGHSKLSSSCSFIINPVSMVNISIFKYFPTMSLLQSMVINIPSIWTKWILRQANLIHKLRLNFRFVNKWMTTILLDIKSMFCGTVLQQHSCFHLITLVTLIIFFILFIYRKSKSIIKFTCKTKLTVFS